MQKLLINDNLISAVRARRDQLAEILEHIALQKKNQPQGKLKVVKKAHFVQFYHRKSPADKEGTYINKKNLRLAKKLAQKAYNFATEQTIYRQLKVLDTFLSNYSEQELVNNYQACPPQLQALIEPFAQNPEDSKSEIMIANALLRASIPYRYEFPVSIKGHRDFHPDFLCLNPHNGNSCFPSELSIY